MAKPAICIRNVRNTATLCGQSLSRSTVSLRHACTQNDHMLSLECCTECKRQFSAAITIQLSEKATEALSKLTWNR